MSTTSLNYIRRTRTVYGNFVANEVVVSGVAPPDRCLFIYTQILAQEYTGDPGFVSGAIFTNIITPNGTASGGYLFTDVGYTGKDIGLMVVGPGESWSVQMGISGFKVTSMAVYIDEVYAVTY